MKPRSHGLDIKKIHILLHERLRDHLFNDLKLRIPVCTIPLDIHS